MRWERAADNENLEELSTFMHITRPKHLLLQTRKPRPKEVRSLTGGYIALSNCIQLSGPELFPWAYETTQFLRSQTTFHLYMFNSRLYCQQRSQRKEYRHIEQGRHAATAHLNHIIANTLVRSLFNFQFSGNHSCVINPLISRHDVDLTEGTFHLNPLQLPSEIKCQAEASLFWPRRKWTG